MKYKIGDILVRDTLSGQIVREVFAISSHCYTLRLINNFQGPALEIIDLPWGIAEDKYRLLKEKQNVKYIEDD